jgi:hypothetical protein
VVDELRRIATALLGTVDIVAKPDDLEADFEAMMRAAMSRGVADARLRVWAPQGSEVLFVRQVAPTGRGPHRSGHVHQPAGRRVPDGGLERREPRLPRGRACAAGARRQRAPRRPCRARRERPGAREGAREGVWSVDTNLTTRIDPAVAHYTGQAQLADVIQRGLAAKSSGDDRTATVLLGQAAKLAHDTGNEQTTRLLAKVVDVVDVEAGTVRLKQQVDKTDEMALDTRSTKTTRIRREP